MNKILLTFFEDLAEMENELHPIDYCDECGKKRKLTYWENGRQAWCNLCWKDWEEFEKKEYKEYIKNNQL